jgi:hypothetical protein
MAVISIADTIFDNPTFNDLNPTGLIPQGGRLMSSAPHTDALMVVGAEGLGKDSANLVLTRNGKGDWSLNRTAAGAETYNVRLYLDQVLRTGEKYFFDLFNQDNKVAAPDKGIAITDFFIIYKSGVVALTTATLRLGKTVYSAVGGGAAPVQTDLVAATGISTANTAQYQFQKLAGPSPVVFHKDDLGLIEVEAVIVMANTGTLQIAAIGCHANFNFN